MAQIPATLLALARIDGRNGEVSVAVRENLQTPPHSHATTNYVVVTAGRLLLTLDGEERAIETGGWCVIPAGAEHAERFVEPTSVIVFWIPDPATPH